jgi:UDP-N-acetyl-D-glucosamine 4,6-dehydratase
VNLFQTSRTKRVLFFLLSDTILIYLSLHLAYSLRFDFVIWPEHQANFLHVFSLLLVLKLFFIGLFKIYYISWRFFSLSDAKKLFYALLSAFIAFGVIYYLAPSLLRPVPRSAIIIDFFLSFIFLGTLRLSKRIILEQFHNESSNPTLIIGVNSRTASIIRSSLSGEIDYAPLGIIAYDSASKDALNSFINNVRVYHSDEIIPLSQKYGIRAAIITQELSQPELKKLVEQLGNAGITDIKRAKILGSHQEKLEDLSIEELLARRPKDLDSTAIATFIKDKTVLITGAGGSIGSDIALQCHAYGASQLILVDNSEFNLYRIGEKLPNALLSLESVTNKKGIEHLFENLHVDIIIHAAAYKHVPICESNPDIAVTNNILGSKNIIDIGIAHQVNKIIIISTDKAVRPTNVMGATKRITELYAQNVDAKGSDIVSVRFGNVLGSSGSVIPKFKQQIEEGGPITVTHPEITRYFMMIPEACQLVLQAASIAKGGELFILDMGKPIKVVDLARQMIRLYGKEREIEIEFCGLRPGEKLYEELLLDESDKTTIYESIFIAPPTHYPIDMLKEDINTLLACSDKLAQLKKIVPEFHHQP